MAIIDIPVFTGIRPRLNEHKLPAENGTVAKNCRIKNGDLESWHSLTPIAAALRSGVVRSIYLYEDVHWFSWNTVVDAVKSPVAQDVYRRIYYTGDVVPKVTSNLIATGSDPKPAASYTLGVQAPANAPTLVVDNAGSDPDDFSDDETRYYFYTYVTEYGEEGPPSPISLPVVVLEPGNSVVVTLADPVTNTENITQIRIYRTATDGDGTDGFRVATVALGTATYDDTLTGSELGSPIETIGSAGPPDDMQGLTIGANGIAAGFAGNQAFFSRAYKLHDFPPEFRLSTEYDIVGIAKTLRGFVFGTKGKPVFFSGTTPDAITDDQIELIQACSSAKSMVDMGNFVLYASPDGLVSVSEGSGASLITESLFTKEQWQEYFPSTIHAYRYEDQYIGFYGDEGDTGVGVGGFIYDPRVQSFTTIDIYATAGHHDIETDSLYLAIGGSLYSWDSGLDNLDYEYVTKTFRTSPITFNCYRAYTTDPARVGFALYRDGQKIWQENSLQDFTGRLPAVELGDRWKIKFFGRGVIERFVLATSMAELAE